MSLTHLFLQFGQVVRVNFDSYRLVRFIRMPSSQIFTENNLWRAKVNIPVQEVNVVFREEVLDWAYRWFIRMKA